MKRIKPDMLCVGDLRHLVDIQTRSLVSSGYGDYNSDQPSETFTTVRQLWCALETVNKYAGRGKTKFSGVNILDGATHALWTRWDSELPDMEVGNTWVLDGTKRYRVLGYTDLHERNQTVCIQLAVRGSSSYAATQS